MRRLSALALAGLAFASGAWGADLYTCKISPDRKSVAVLVSNPYAQETHCTVNCHLILPGSGIHSESISCGKTVPAAAKDFELCTRSRDKGEYLRVDSDSNAECVKPLAENTDDAAKDDDDDKLAEEMQKKSLEMLKSLQKK